jgi:hypothetical protein
MARDASSREDLLREATALVERIEFVPRTGNTQHIVAGFRRDGALSVFFGDDPVYQFNANSELRRAYIDGKLLKATHGHLAALQRVQTQAEVQLIRHQLSRDEEVQVLSQMDELLRRLSRLIDTSLFEIVGQVPPDADVLSRLKTWLVAGEKRSIATKPNA